MTTSNRATLINKTHKVLKRTYKHTPTKGEQPVLESLLFACCLENARHDLAHDMLAKLRAAFFDWNEIRVTTVKELAEVMDGLPEATEAAARLKGVLQSVFESDYSFDLEPLKKQNIGAAVKRLQKLQGATPFGVAFTTQNALGGHSIPLDRGALGSLHVLGVISQQEAAEGVVPGLERAIPKSKGQEFGALLHELGADFFVNPFSPALRELLLSIAPDAKDRFPKAARRRSREPQRRSPARPLRRTASERKKTRASQAKKPAAKHSERRGRRTRPRRPHTPRRSPPAARKKPSKPSPSASRGSGALVGSVFACQSLGTKRPHTSKDARSSIFPRARGSPRCP